MLSTICIGAHGKTYTTAVQRALRTDETARIARSISAVARAPCISPILDKVKLCSADRMFRSSFSFDERHE
jgi:hypothetical protein